MTKPVYDIPMTEGGGVPFGAPPATAPPSSSPLPSSPPPTVLPDGSPVSGANEGAPSAAPRSQPWESAPPTAAPETVFPPPMPAPTASPVADFGPPPMSDFVNAPPPAGGSTATPMAAPRPAGAPDPALFFSPPAPDAGVGSAASAGPAATATAPPAAAPSAGATAFAAPAPTAAPVSSAPAPTGAPSTSDVLADAIAAASAAATAAAASAPTRSAARPATASAAPSGSDENDSLALSDDDVADLNPGTDIPDADLIAALQQVLLTGASDLHVASGAQPMLRVDGGLNPIADLPVWDRSKVKTALWSLLSPKLRERFEENLELDFAYTLSANARFRVNYYQDRGSMGAAFRIIPTRIKTLKELGVGQEVAQFSSLPRGLVLVTGPTGSGKSTTLAAMIDLVNETRRDHVVTVEDPIEFLHNNKKSLINQREVGRDTHSFGNALKHVLRQDPDVILIGELRDLETISIALTAAETGHLVFATLHTQSAPTTIDRVIDVFPPHQQGQVRTQLAATLQGVVCQTLVKKASGSGRAVATEVMFTTPAVSNLIREGKTYQVTSVLPSGTAQGMHTMDQALADLVNEGTITRAAAIEKSQDTETLERLIHRVDMNSNVDQPFAVLDDVDRHAQQQAGGRH